ncbi:restriction endonuclease subunit S [Streptomyces colonosanans]|uniref:restriction endonuclease subunit S n=1 Tax=Streptomyces colonosanans TaxID=1428652 RepID=UPI0015A658AF|nr:restriction endonuclease subunit S [Streptomyces colonosanans]
MGKQLSPASRTGAGQWPYLRVANVYEGRIDYSDVNSMAFSAAERETYGLMPGDILLNEGQENLMMVGRSALYDGAPGEYCFQNTLIRFRPGPDVLPEFAQAVFVWWRANAVFAGIAEKTSISHLGGIRFGALLFPLIPVAAQRRIVEVLAGFTELERGIEAEIRKLELIGASVIKRRLNDLYSASKLLTLADVASVERGKFSARPRNDPAYFGGTYGFIQTGDVASAQRGVIRRASQRLNDAGLAVSRSFPVGTVAVTIAATIGETAILGQSMCFPDSVVGVVANDGVDPRFLEICLHRVKGDLEGKAPQSAQRNINLQDLRPLAVPSVPLGTQADLVNLWETYRGQAALMKDELTKLRRLRQGLVGDLLPGRFTASAVTA